MCQKIRDTDVRINIQPFPIAILTDQPQQLKHKERRIKETEGGRRMGPSLQSKMPDR